MPPGFFFLILYIFFDCKLLYLVLCHDVLLPLTMSIVYLFVSVLLLYQSVIKIDVPNKWEESGQDMEATRKAKKTELLGATYCIRPSNGRPAKSSDKAEHIPRVGSFLNLRTAFPIYFESRPLFRT